MLDIKLLLLNSIFYSIIKKKTHIDSDDAKKKSIS